MSSLTTPLAMCAKRFDDLSLEMFRRFRLPMRISFDVSGKVWVDVGGDDKTEVAQQQGFAIN
jgi:hypothetical protein